MASTVQRYLYSEWSVLRGPLAAFGIANTMLRQGKCAAATRLAPTPGRLLWSATIVRIGCGGVGVHGKIVVGFRPRWSAQELLHVDITLLDQTGLGVDDPVTLPLLMNRLAFQNDYADFPFVEVAPSLQRGHQLFVVQMSFPEVPAQYRSGDVFAVTDDVVGFVVDRARHQRVERAAVCVHGPPGQHFAEHHFSGGGIVEPCQLPVGQL